VEYWQKMRQLVGHETLVLPGAAGAIIQDGKILLVRHLSKKWHIPGGLQHLGEPIQQTVQREIREELGLELETAELISVYSSSQWQTEYLSGDKVQQLLFFFRMRGELTEIKLQESELSEYQFFALVDIPENTMDCCKQKVLDLMAYAGQPIFR
jgi:ADP-ribose pyrophosphatase YjhB (NUDIX family)